MANINSALNRGANLLRQDVLSSLYGSVTKPDDLWMPYEFTSPKEEVLAAYETAWIGTYLQTGDGIGGHFLLTGPDAVKFMNKYTANRDFALLRPAARATSWCATTTAISGASASSARWNQGLRPLQQGG